MRMHKVQGRTDDMMVIRGVNVFPSQIETVIAEFNELTMNYKLYVGRENNTDTFELAVELAENLEAPVYERQIIGKLTLTLDGGVAAEYDVYAARAVERLGFGRAFTRERDGRGKTGRKAEIKRVRAARNGRGFRRPEPSFFCGRPFHICCLSKTGPECGALPPGGY